MYPKYENNNSEVNSKCPQKKKIRDSFMSKINIQSIEAHRKISRNYCDIDDDDDDEVENSSVVVVSIHLK